MKLILLGPPGVGKGTQAEKLANHLGIANISTGEMLRAVVNEDSVLGQEVKMAMQAGELVPDQIMVEMVKTRLQKSDAKKGFILDGFPRNIAQAEALASNGIELDHVLQITGSEEVVIGRMMGRKRADDQKNTIRNRLRVYEKQTSPLVQYYQEHGILRSINGEGEVPVVFQQILEVLGES